MPAMEKTYIFTNAQGSESATDEHISNAYFREIKEKKHYTWNDYSHQWKRGKNAITNEYTYECIYHKCMISK